MVAKLQQCSYDKAQKTNNEKTVQFLRQNLLGKVFDFSTAANGCSQVAISSVAHNELQKKIILHGEQTSVGVCGGSFHFVLAPSSLPPSPPVLLSHDDIRTKVE